ncbi:3-deoxy-8-phosphooctulonate synthase, partial [Escherichia coli]|nr:3-deoxy-8-phosphooctulonate synthase [Escherichia coli]
MQLFGHEIGNDRRLFLIAGPCVLESEQLALDIASTLATLARRLGILVIFK